LYSNTTGSNNTAIGFNSLFSNTEAGNNTALGFYAGDGITTGNNNVMLGYGTDPSAVDGTNQIVVGASAVGHGDNIAVIGNSNMTAIHPADDNGVDLGSSSYSYKDLYVDGTANINTVQAANFVPTAIGDKYVEITIEGVYGDGTVIFDLDAALGSNNTWYKLEALAITEWDGSQSFFDISMNVLPNIGSFGDLSVEMQSFHTRPKFNGNRNVFFLFSENGQHELEVHCNGRNSTIKILFRVTSDWS
jgi:hypothetical protein